ncbi:MAG: T9SS type A sorting domain-containing protein [Saprospiraceae bacterium]|nr:T9SS type A sorting domain-containing protein [Saprospiraceae bacterium]
MKNISLLICLFVLPFLGHSQSNALAQKVQEAKAQKSVFTNPNLFQFAGLAKSASQFDDLVAEGKLLTLDLGRLKSLYQSGPESLELELPNGDQKPLKLELVRHQLLTEDFTLVTSTSNGQPVDYEPGVYYRGIVQGNENSIAAISIFEDEIIGVVSTSKEGNMVLGRTDGTAKSANYIFYKEDDLLLENNFECGAGEEPVSEGKDSPNTGNEKVAKCVRAYLEAEYNLVTEKGGATQATNFLTGLFNAVAAAYQAEAITTYISQIFTWTTADPYATSSTSAALTSFRNYRPTYNGDVPHLVSRGAPTGGGIAWVDALCTSYAYAYSYINSTYNQFPTYSWSVEVLTHEMGHNLGSPHTHACAWNGNNTAIDGCGPAVGANEGCNAPLPAQGTIMSYCHLVNGVGINFNLGFGPQPGDKIRTEVTSATCLTTCASQCLTVATSGINVSCFGGNNGSATATAGNGTAPYTYAWSNGGTTQTISNLTAGTYTVTVTASGNCTGTATRIVTAPAVLSGSTTVTNTSNGQNNGTINLTVSGGTPAYTFLWSNGATTEDIANLAPATYTVTVTDSKGCTATKSATVSTSSAPPITLSFSVTNASSGQNNGAIDMTVSGGTAPFTYLWSNGATTQDLVNIAAGTYNVTVTDATSTKTGSATVGTNSGDCTSANLPHTQSFESGLGDWSQATNDQMDWTLLSGSTPTASTGPDNAANGSFYAYTEATGNTNKIAYLLSPCLNIAGINTFQLSFNYHRYGSQMGTLRLQFSLNNGNTWSTIWTKQGNQGNSWKTQTLNFTNNGGSSIRFRMFATTGGDRSDMAIDNFSVVQTGNLTNGDPGETSIVLNPDVKTVDISLSPNPVDDELTVSFFSATGQSGKIMVSDQMGRTIQTKNMEATEGNNYFQLDVAGLPTGLYFLTVEEGQNRRVERFVVLR